MEICKGLENWLECLKCPRLCTKKCPIESENVIEEMKKQLRLLSAPGMTKDGKVFGK